MMIACLFLSAVLPRGTEACSCVPPTSELKDEADVVFVGEVVSVDAQDSGQSQGARVAVLTVVERFKSAAAEILSIRTSKSAATCGVEFRVGERYLVFAFEDAGRLETGLCSTLNTKASLAQELLGVLRAQ